MHKFWHFENCNKSAKYMIFVTFQRLDLQLLKLYYFKISIDTLNPLKKMQISHYFQWLYEFIWVTKILLRSDFVSTICKQSNQHFLNIYLLSALTVHNSFCWQQNKYTILTVYFFFYKINERLIWKFLDFFVKESLIWDLGKANYLLRRSSLLG